VGWILVAQDMELGCAFVKMIMNFPILKEAWALLIIRAIIIGF
jgi:hypothetical protein